MHKSLVTSILNCPQIALAAQTCPANLEAKCDGDSSDGWQGEFFPEIPKIKYEVSIQMHFNEN